MSSMAEQALVGIILINPEKFDSVSEIITHNDFMDSRHSEFFKAAGYLADDNTSIDIITICDKISDMGLAPEFSYFTELAKSVSATANVMAYARVISDESEERRILRIASEMTSIIHGDGSTDEKRESIEQLIGSVSKDTGNSVRDASTVMQNLVSQWQERSERDGSLIGYSTGFVDIDKRTMGLTAPDLTIIAAASGKGKTTFAMNIVQSVAIDQNIPVLVFSLEMSAEQLLDRMAAAVGKIPLSMIRAGTVFGSEYDHSIIPTVKKIKESNLFIDDRGGLSIGQIKATSRKFFRNHKNGLLVVDYIGLVSGKGGNKEEQIANVSGGLKSLAKELSIPVVALAQINRNNVQRGDKRPAASDLRNSAAIEHDSDCLMMLYEDEENNPGVMEVHFEKLRNGETGTDYLIKRLDVNRFENQEKGFTPEVVKSGKFEY